MNRVGPAIKQIVLLGVTCLVFFFSPWAWGEEYDPFGETETPLGDDAAPMGDTSDNPSFLDEVTVTLAHDYAYGISPDVGRTVVNRSWLKSELGTTLWGGLFVRFDGKAYVFWDTDHRADTEDDNPSFDGDIRELYVQKENDRLSVRVGKQVVVWGETDGDVINDVIAPRDEREFVFTDLENARMGLFMVTASLYSAWGDLFTFVTLEPGINEIPDRGDRYDLTPAGVVVHDAEPHGSDREFGLKWKKTFHGYDVSLMAASLYRNRGVMESMGPGELGCVYSRYGFYGMGARFTTENVLFNLDVSIKDRFRVQAVDEEGFYRVDDARVSDNALGMEYDANGAYTLNLEVTHRHVWGDSKGLTPMDPHLTGVYAAWRRLFFHDTLTAQYSYFHQFQYDHSVHKAELEYDCSDRLTLKADLTVIEAEDETSPFWAFRHEDRMGVEVAYCF